MTPPDQEAPTATQGVLLHIGIFFDGTRNNARNRLASAGRPPAQARAPALQADDASPYHSRITSSSDNGLTNIARLHALYADARHAPEGPLSVAIYTEGTGTRDGQPDDLIGLAFGIGSTGVCAKVDRALREQLPDALQALAARRPAAASVSGVRVDLFGFSRGAASARHAAVELSAWSSARWLGLLREGGLTVAASFALAPPVIGFIGLFDTVVAVSGGRADEQPRVHLPAALAGQVVHLVARDEHRSHFALTSVAPEHVDTVLPGVHANIGGGYDQAEEGPKLLLRPRSQRIRRPPVADFGMPDQAWLHATDSHRAAMAAAATWRQQLGLDDTQVWAESWHQWLRQRQTGSSSALPSPTLYVYSTVVLKRPIDWRYSLVALRLMHQRAAAAGVPWAQHPDALPELALPAELQPVQARLQAGQALTDAQEALLKRRYVMQSAHWNFDALGDTALAYAADASVSELPYRPGPGLFYVNRPTEDGQRRVLGNV